MYFCNILDILQILQIKQFQWVRNLFFLKTLLLNRVNVFNGKSYLFKKDTCISLAVALVVLKSFKILLSVSSVSHCLAVSHYSKRFEDSVTGSMYDQLNNPSYIFLFDVTTKYHSFVCSTMFECFCVLLSLFFNLKRTMVARLLLFTQKIFTFFGVWFSNKVFFKIFIFATTA